MDPKLYLGLGILTSFILLSTISKPNQLEAFQELVTIPKRSLDQVTPTTGETITTNASGIVLNQGPQAIRVGTADIILYTNNAERARVSNSGPVLIGVSQTSNSVNNSNQYSPLVVGGNLTLTGKAMLTASSANYNSYFTTTNGAYDMGGMSIIDRSLDSGSTTVIQGEWIQYKLAFPISAVSYSIAPVASFGHNGNRNIPNSFQLIGSNDGNIWTVLDTQINQQSNFNTTPAYTTYTIANPSVLYSYFRIVFTQLVATPSSTTYGPMIELSGFILSDPNGNFYPPIMSQNTQTFGSNTYSLSASTPSGHTFSYINNTIQSASANLVALTQNPPNVQGGISSSSYYVMAYPYSNNIYTISGSVWNPTGITYNVALFSSAPYNSAVALKAIYHGSAPTECMRAVYGQNGPQIGIGTSVPSATLTVNGNMVTSYSSFNDSDSIVCKSLTHNNSIETTCGISTSTNQGFSSILFHSVDNTGTSTSNTSDAGIYCIGGTSGTSGKGSISIMGGSFSCMTANTSFPVSNVGVGTTSAMATMHVHGGNLMLSKGSTVYTGYGGEIEFNTADTVSYYSMGKIRGKFQSANTTTKENSGGLGFYVRPSNNSSTAQSMVEALSIYHNGNVGIGTTTPLYPLTINGGACFASGTYGFYTGTDLINCTRLWYNGTGGVLDFNTSLQIRCNTSSSSVISYVTNLTCYYNGYTGTVGIGSTTPGINSAGVSPSYGLDIAYSGTTRNDVLRLSNTSTSSGSAKDVGMQFVLTDALGKQKVQSRIVSETSADSSGSMALGQLNFYLKTSDASLDTTDLSIRGSIAQTGLISGNFTETSKLALLVANKLGSAYLGISGRIGDWSADSASGDTVLTSYTPPNGSTPAQNRNLILQSGSGRSAVYINSLNYVGIGTNNPQSLFDVYYPMLNVITSVTSTGAGPYNYMNTHAADTTYSANGIAGFAPSAQITGGNLKFSNGSYSYGASMIVEGGNCSTSGSVVNGTIKFYTGTGTFSGVTPVVQIGNTNYATNQTYTYFQLNSAYVATNASQISSYAIFAQDNILVGNGKSFIAFSDERLKKNIKELDEEESLRKINELVPCSYEMRDIVQPGTQFGVIAQQVKNIIPEAVNNQGAQYIANLLIMVDVIEDQMILLESEPKRPLVVGDWIRLINDDGMKRDAKVEECLTKRLFKISEQLDRSDRWILYGTKEEDVLAVDKDMISMVAVSAIQGLTKRLRRLENRIEEIEKRL